MGRPRIHEVQEFLGIRYYQKPGGYYKSDWLKHGGKLMHRMVWEHTSGRPVPKGYCIHHLNGDRGDNRPENLCILAVSTHGQYHVRKNIKEIPEQMARGIRAAREAAKKWHGSAEGKDWHRDHGRESWKRQRKQKYACTVCGKDYWTYPQSRKRGFCSPACQQRMRRKEHPASSQKATAPEA